MHSILIVEDEPTIASPLLYALENEGFQTHHCTTCHEAKKHLQDHKTTLCILDIGLPDGSGLELCKEIRQNSDMPILFLSARTDEIDRVLGLELGGDDYVTKPFSPREVVARVKTILKRTEKNTDSQSEQVTKSFKINDAHKKICFHKTVLELTKYEYGILKLLLKRPGQVYSRSQIMNQVWDEPDMSLERTVDTHIKGIRSKLKTIHSDEYLTTHRGLGYSIKA